MRSSSVGELYGLTLLQVCRQIYEETRLIPFSTNAWTMYTVDSLDKWMAYQHVLPGQSQAIKTYKVYGNENGLTFKLHAGLTRRLSGLTRVVVQKHTTRPGQTVDEVAIRKAIVDTMGREVKVEFLPQRPPSSKSSGSKPSSAESSTQT
ncbi:hypothetical protein BDV96DRAFT_380613 [Lophiotrema nucula]|uniref:Uncharacterized protein n=1 Tax=Lophiotrema nucula TaxID=690887 RepID=A0A6A5ZFI5_9PLEO|nr:hypothetical protein BDV96DRAFT_380613 [Lophiotrema nucula]